MWSIADGVCLHDIGSNGARAIPPGKVRNAMKHARFATLAAAALFVLLSANASAMELDRFLDEIDVTASADIGNFRARLSATFDVSSGEVDGLFEIFNRPADVYITLRIGELSGVPYGRVVDQYRKNKGRGWGVIAKNLGIKPGSAEFHALKEGRLGTRTRADASVQPAKGNGHGSGKGKRGK
jgi:hypothetical protein